MNNILVLWVSYNHSNLRSFLRTCLRQFRKLPILVIRKKRLEINDCVLKEMS